MKAFAFLRARIRLPVLALLVTLFTGVRDAAAWPVIQAISTEPAGTPEFPLVRTNFTLNYVGTGPISDRFVAILLTGRQAIGCEAPPGWDCFAFSKGPSVTSFRRVDGALPPPALPFSIDSIDGEPCLRIQFFSQPSNDLDYEVVGCLTVDGPVPTRPSSWGRVKSTYR